MLGSAGNSKVALSANLNLGGGSVFNISDAGGTPAGTYDLISFTGDTGGSAGNVSSATLNLPSGWEGSLGSNSTDVFLTLTKADALVPEPSTWTEIFLGVVALVVVSRRRQARQL